MHSLSHHKVANIDEWRDRESSIGSILIASLSLILTTRELILTITSDQ